MGAARYPIRIEQGATWRTVLTVKDDTGQPVDLTGYTARMQIRQDYDTTTVLAELTTANGGITINGDNGQVTLLIADEDTAAYTWTSGVYDLELVSGSGDVTRLLQGPASLDLEVTR